MKGGSVFDREKREYSYVINIWDKNNNYVGIVFNKRASSLEKCLELAQNEPVFDGKTFWEAEADMEWVEW